MSKRWEELAVAVGFFTLGHRTSRHATSNETNGVPSIPTGLSPPSPQRQVRAAPPQGKSPGRARQHLIPSPARLSHGQTVQAHHSKPLVLAKNPQGRRGRLPVSGADAAFRVCFAYWGRARGLWPVSADPLRLTIFPLKGSTRAIDEPVPSKMHQSCPVLSGAPTNVGSRILGRPPWVQVIQTSM